MTGHDGTYVQTIQARKIYFSEDFFVGSRFVDVIEFPGDGRLLVDYTKCHDVEPDSDPGEGTASEAPDDGSAADGRIADEEGEPRHDD